MTVQSDYVIFCCRWSVMGQWISWWVWLSSIKGWSTSHLCSPRMEMLRVMRTNRVKVATPHWTRMLWKTGSHASRAVRPSRPLIQAWAHPRTQRSTKRRHCQLCLARNEGDGSWSGRRNVSYAQPSLASRFTAVCSLSHSWARGQEHVIMMVKKMQYLVTKQEDCKMVWEALLVLLTWRTNHYC